MDYRKIKGSAVSQYRSTEKLALKSVKAMSVLVDLIRTAEESLDEQEPLSVGELFNAVKNLRNKLHRRPKKKRAKQ